MNVYVFIYVEVHTKRGLWQCCAYNCASPCSRGDQILEVDSFSLRHAALSEAYAILSECGPGPVSLILSRHPNPKVRVCLSLFTVYRLISSFFKIFNIYLVLCKSPIIYRTAWTLGGLFSKTHQKVSLRILGACQRNPWPSCLGEKRILIRSLPAPVTENQPHSMKLPSQCIAGMMGFSWWEVIGRSKILVRP